MKISNVLEIVKVMFIPVSKLSFKHITKKNLPFSIGWIIMFIWLYSYFLPFGEFRFESNLYNEKVGNPFFFTCVWLIVCPLITVLFDGRKYVPKTFYSVIIAIVCFLGIRLVPGGVVSQAILFLGSACMGHIFASSCYSFFMVLNNSEKFYSMILAVLLPKLLMFFRPILNSPEAKLDGSTIFIALLLIILAVCSFLYRNNIDDMPKSSKVKAPSKAYYLMPVVFIVLGLNDVFAPTTIRNFSGLAPHNVESLYFYGVLIGTSFLIFVQKKFSVNICNMLNVSFALTTIGFVFSLIHHENLVMGCISIICFGAAYMIGLTNIYYLAGFMAKKFQSVSFYRIGIVLSSLYYFSSLSVVILSKSTIDIIPGNFMALFSIIVIIMFFALSPIFLEMLYGGEWIDDTYRLDVTMCTRLEAKLKDFKLTPAETEVCKLLLNGYSLKQIAAIEGKAYATINTYYVSVYRKLGIQSKVELMILFKEYIKTS